MNPEQRAIFAIALHAAITDDAKGAASSAKRSAASPDGKSGGRLADLARSG